MLGTCRIGGTPEEFARQVEAALADPGPSVVRSESVRDQSWRARLDEIRGHMTTLL